MSTMRTTHDRVVPHVAFDADRTATRADGWLRAVAPLWPLGLARIVYGYLWWQQSAWKVPSDDFGRKSGGGLWYWVQQEIQHPTVGAYRDFLNNVMIPHWTFFGWMTLITESRRAVAMRRASNR